jgi:hypothetical protein
VRNLRPAVLSLGLLLAACGSESNNPTGTSTPSQELGLPENVWTWVDVPGTVCSDGSPTGMAVNPGPSSSGNTLVLFLNGGGACWDPITCRAGLAEGGPYGRTQFESDLASKAPGTIIDRAVADPIYGGATLVFIPYCTGDVHWGTSTNDYPGVRTWHHAGQPNLAADIAWLAARVASPTRLVVSGSSAGGYGSLLAHDLARTAWPGAKGYLIDDSGPPLIGNDVPSTERTAWYASWRLDLTLAPLCPGCRDDLSQILPTLAAKYPQDRIALLSSRRDPVISAFLFQTPSGFESALLQLVDERILPLANGRAFLVDGNDHALLRKPGAYAAGGAALPSWLGQMVNDDPAWATAGR